VISRPGIRVREAVAYTLTFALAVVTVGAFQRWHIAGLYKQEMAYWRARQSSLADNQTQRVSDWLKERRGNAQVFAVHSLVHAVLRAYYEAGQLPKHPSAGPPELLAALDEMAKSYSYAGVYILDRDAQVVAQSSRSIPFNPLFSETCRAVSRSGVMGITLVGDAPSRSLIGFSAPVFPGPGRGDAGRPPGQLLGIVLVVSDASQTLFPLVTREVVPTRTGETLLVRREGNDMVYFSPLRHVPAGSQDLRFPLSTAPAPARLALEGRETFVEYRDYRGVPVLAATQHIALTGWGLVRKIDRAEALEGFRRTAIAEGLSAGLLIILVGGLLLFHRRYVVTRVLKQEEEKFRALLESAPDAIYIIEPSTLRILGRNRKAAELDGYSDEDIAHMSATDLHPPEDHPLLREWFERGSGAGGVLCLHTVQRKDGQLVPVEESQTPVDAGGERLVLGIVRDITERKRAEETLRESETRYRTLVENIPQSIFMKSRDYRWVSVNENFARSLGVRPEDIVGKVDYDLFPKELADKYHADDKRIMETGVTDEFDEEYMERNERRIVHTIKTPMRDEGGTVTGVLGVFWDVTERKRAEEALRESGERAQIVAESVADVIYEWDLKDKVEWYGDVDSLMGYPAGGFPRTLEGWRATLHPEDKERVWLAIDSQLKGVAPYNVDYRVAGKDGRWRWWSARGGVLRDEQGEPRRWVGAITDITERKRAEEALQESGTAFRTLAEVVPQLVWMCTPDGLSIYFNQRWVDYTGLTLEESYGRGWTIPFHAEDKQAAWDAWNHAVESGGKYSIECRLRGADGTYRWFLTRGVPLRDAAGGIVKWFGTYTDIDDLKRAQQDLVQSHERLAMALRVGQSGTFEWDIQNNINVWSPQVEALYGVERGMFGGTYQDWESFLLPEDLETAKSGIQESLKSGEFKGEWRIRRHSDGEIRWLGARAKVLFDEAGRPTHMIGINTDITERKRAEEEVQKLNEQLEQRVAQRTAELEAANKELEAFTYSVSHDLRAPLRHVDGFSKLLVEQHQAELSPDAQEYVAIIRDSVLQMGILIDDLLNLARVGRKQLVMQVTGLNSLVEEVRTDLNRANPDRVIEWKVETLPFAECDPALIKQVFANLLSNAVKFTRPRKPAVIEVGAIRQDDHPVVFVRDNGVGFSMKYAPKLFGVFQRLHRAEDFEGTGVGLATVQRIIHKHGGLVWAEAELDKGATFYFTLGSPDDPSTGKPGGEST